MRHEEDMRFLCRPKQLEIETYWGKLREVYDSYLEQHNPIMNHYQALREKDDFYQKDIARNEVLIQQATELVDNLQKEWIKTTTTMSQKLKRMNGHKEELAKKYWMMKKESKSDKENCDERLAILVDASQDAIKRLEDVEQKIHKITQMGQICAKYEQEKDDMFLEDIEDDDDVNFENLDKAMIDECKEYSKMNKFLLKVNRAQVQTMCLRTEKAKLAKENVQLKQYIKRYLTELALKGGKDRPLSVRLQSEVNKIDNAVKINRPLTCIEGALSNAVMHEKRLKVEAKRMKELGGIQAFPRFYC